MATSTSVLLSIKETVSALADQADVYTPEYGICCVDTVIGTVTLAQFQDDSQRSRLRTRLFIHPPPLHSHLSNAYRHDGNQVYAN